MSADLHSSQASGVESPPSAARVRIEGQTLTLPLRARGAMSGRLEICEPAGPLPETVRLRVAMPPHEPFNFTA
jgi:hypothetical protein